ncbi:hypothetical protein D3C72_1794940 [compost metagenome]
MAFIVWCDLWQWKAQSPGSVAVNSTARIWPTAISVVTSGQRDSGRVQPPSVPVTSNSWPCMWIGWFVMVRLPTRTRTLSPWRTTIGSIPGKTRLLKVNKLKSVMVMIFGV